VTEPHINPIGDFNAAAKFAAAKFAADVEARRQSLAVEMDPASRAVASDSGEWSGAPASPSGGTRPTIELLADALDIVRHYRSRRHVPSEYDGWYTLVAEVDATIVALADRLLAEVKP